MNIVQNEKAKVENLNIVSKVKDAVVLAATQKIANTVIDYDSISDIVEDTCTAISVELKNSVFFTEELELNKKQVEKINEVFRNCARGAVKVYKEKLNKDKRAAFVVDVIQSSVKAVLEQLLAGIAAEVNRGCMLNSVVAKANTTNSEHNVAELWYSKTAGDITVPTTGVFISTNCLDIIKNSVEVKESEESDEKAS